MTMLGLQSGYDQLKRVLTLPEAPHAIALGAAIGVFLAFTPALGLQMIGAFALATLFRASKAAAVAAVWISNPLTAAPIYAGTYQLGVYVMPSADIITALSVGGVILGLLFALTSYPLIHRAIEARKPIAA